MSVTDIGTIKKLNQDEKGFYKLIISVNMPFYTKYLQFEVWGSELLQNSDGQKFELEDQVEVEYYFKRDSLGLISLTRAHIEYCPVCFNGLERIETQRMDCRGCSLVPYYEQRERINSEMVLVACTDKQYSHSTGYRLEFFEPCTDSSFISVVFPNKPLLYSMVPSLHVGKVYTVMGWKDKNIFDLLDIHESNDYESQ